MKSRGIRRSKVQIGEKVGMAASGAIRAPVIPNIPILAWRKNSTVLR